MQVFADWSQLIVWMTSWPDSRPSTWNRPPNVLGVREQRRYSYREKHDAYLVRPCDLLLLADGRCEQVLDLDLAGDQVEFPERIAADGDGGVVRARAVLLLHKVDQGDAGERVVLVDGIGRCELVRTVGEEVDNSGCVRRAQGFCDEERRVHDRADGPLLEQGQVCRWSCIVADISTSIGWEDTMGDTNV